MGGGRVSWEGRGGFRWGFFLTAFIPSGLGLSTSWEPAGGGGLHQVRGAPTKPVTRGSVEMHPLTPTPTVQV